MKVDEHKVLKILSYRRLSVMDYTCFYEATLQNGGLIDVCGLNGKKRNKKIGIECLTNPDKNNIKNKFNKYKDYFNIVIFSFYDDVDKEIVKYTKSLNKKIRVWLHPNISILDKSDKIEEILCNSCYNSFFVSNIYNYCPYCGGNNFKSIYKNNNEFDNNKNRIIKLKNKKCPLIILKNPQYVKLK